MEDKKLYMKVLALMAVTVVSIVSMAAILVHERGRMREIEAEAGEIQEIRRDITVAQRSITTLATLGEGIIGWEEADYRHYRTRRLRTDSLLQAMKPRCKDFVRPAQIDTLRALLVEKEAHLLHLMETFARQDKADSLLVNHLPEVAKRATRVRTVTPLRQGTAPVQRQPDSHAAGTDGGNGGIHRQPAYTGQEAERRVEPADNRT